MKTDEINQLMGNFAHRYCQRLRPVLLTPFLFGVAFSSCSRAPEPAPPPNAVSNEKVFEVRGVVRSIDSDGTGAMIEHEDIPGFMPSMTMPFTVKDPEELKRFSAGDGVVFRFFVGDSDAWIGNLRPIDAATLKLPESEAKVEAPNVPRLKEGDPLPEFALVDEADRPLTRESLLGKTTVVTFIFTRCPIPNFCPLMSSNFLELQKKLEADPSLAGQVGLLSISFDPEDTPERLAKYGTNIGADPALWHHASGTKEETRKLTHAFSVYVRAEDGGSFSHGLCTALVTPDGTVAKLWRGNDWSVDEVWQAVEASRK